MAPAAAVVVAGEARGGGGEAVNGGKRSRRRGRRRSDYFRRLSCLKPAADPPAAGGGGDRSLDKGDDGERERRNPTHLVVTVNGLIGRCGATGPIHTLSDSPFLFPKFFSFPFF